MKNNRHTKILELINKYPITTQEELIDYLRADGFDVTQSTVSRDIKQLRLTKTLLPDGKYRYQASPSAEKGAKNNFDRIISSSVVSIVLSIKTKLYVGIVSTSTYAMFNESGFNISSFINLSNCNLSATYPDHFITYCYFIGWSIFY